MISSLILTPNLDTAVPQELNDGLPITVRPGGPEMPIVSYEEEYAESQDTEGGRRVLSRAQNPSGRIPLVLLGTVDATYWAALKALQQTVEACRRHGGTLTYSPGNGADVVTYDLESIRISGLPHDSALTRRVAQPDIEFTCRPYARLAAVAIVTNATSSLPIQSVSLPGITGSVDALVSATVTDQATQNRDHLEIGIDPDWDGVAALLIDSATMSVTGLAGANATRTGAYSGATNNVRRATLATREQGICEATGLTHRGKHRVKARIYASGAGPYYVRARYRIGSGPWATAAREWKLGLDDQWQELDLGLVRANHEAGTLTVRIEAYSSTGGDTLDVDYIELMPTGRYLKARGGTSAGADPIVARDEFDQTAGALTGKVLPLGGTWAGAGDADDFSINATTKKAERTAVSDTGPRFGLAGTATFATVEVGFTPGNSTVIGPRIGILARYVDASNYLAAYFEVIGAGRAQLNVVKVVAGVSTTLGTVEDLTTQQAISLIVTAAGGWSLKNSVGDVLLSGSDSVLATGGALASGRIGLYDYNSTATAATRIYDNFNVSTPDIQHVISASQAVVADHESIRRTDGARPPIVTGRYLTCPPAGREGRTHRMAIKLRRNDVDLLTDDQMADLQRVDVTVTPRTALL